MLLERSNEIVYVALHTIPDSFCRLEELMTAFPCSHHGGSHQSAGQTTATIKMPLLYLLWGF